MTFSSKPNGFGAKGGASKKYAVAIFFAGLGYGCQQVRKFFAGLGYEVKHEGRIVAVVLCGQIVNGVRFALQKYS